jgi:hypothetical protein
VDINPAKEEWGRRFGMTHFVNPKTVSATSSSIWSRSRTGGRTYSFDCTGNTEVMRTALEACHRGWGESIIIGVAEAGREISTRPFQLVTGRVWKGSAFGGARGRTDTPRIVDWYMDGKIEIDPMITHRFPLERINEAFDLMHAGESIRSVVVYLIRVWLAAALAAAASACASQARARRRPPSSEGRPTPSTPRTPPGSAVPGGRTPARTHSSTRSEMDASGAARRSPSMPRRTRADRLLLRLPRPCRWTPRRQRHDRRA